MRELEAKLTSAFGMNRVIAGIVAFNCALFEFGVVAGAGQGRARRVGGGSAMRAGLMTLMSRTPRFCALLSQ